MECIFNIKSFKCRNLFPQSLLIFLLFSIFSCNNAPTYNAQYIYDLGKKNHYGQAGFSKNYEEAICLYGLAATLGHAEAQYRLGIESINFRKEATSINIRDDDFLTKLLGGVVSVTGVKIALSLFYLAANQGHTEAKHDFGIVLYNFGLRERINKNYTLAYAWFSLSASNGNKLAIKHRDRFVTSLDSTQLELYDKSRSENFQAEYLRELSEADVARNKTSIKILPILKQYVDKKLSKPKEDKKFICSEFEMEMKSYLDKFFYSIK